MIMKNNIRKFRRDHEVTQDEFAEALGVSRQTIVAIENHKYNPSLELAFKISRYFGVPVEDLFEYSEQGSSISS